MIRDYGREYKFKTSTTGRYFYDPPSKEITPENMEKMVLDTFRSLLAERGVKETADFLGMFIHSVHSGELSRDSVKNHIEDMIAEEGREQAELEKYDSYPEDIEAYQDEDEEQRRINLDYA